MTFRILKYLSLVVLFNLCLSCDGKEPAPGDDPENLSIEIIYSEEVTGQVQVIAAADNAVEYRFYSDYMSEPDEINTSGVYTYQFYVFGVHHIEIRAYGKSGRYVKEEREIIVGSDEVSLENGYSTPLSYDGFELAWNDEFEGNELKSQYWTHETGTGCPGNCGWGNNELQYYRKNNTDVGEGVLTITARKENFEGQNYTSSRIVTKGLKSFKYGRIDIRALLPAGQGLWPALWMLGNNFQTAGWPNCGEIDIMEMIGGDGRENTTHGTVHWGGPGGEHFQAGGSKSLSDGTLGDEYHVFSILWDENSIKWLLNDEQFYVISITPDDLSEFHQNFFFIFNLAVGGNWPGNPDQTTIFPQQMKVDYVRVFQKK